MYIGISATNNDGTYKFSGLSIAGKITVVSINSTTWTEITPTPLMGRNALCIQNKSGQDIVLNYDPLVVGVVGIVIEHNGQRQYDIQGSIPIYLKCTSGTTSVIIEELS